MRRSSTATLAVVVAAVWASGVAHADEIPADELPESTPVAMEPTPAEPARTRMAALVLRAGGARVSPELADSITELIITVLAATGEYDLVGKEEVKSFLRADDELKALECLTSAPCLGLLATHLGVRKALVGTVEQEAGVFRLSLSLVNLETGETENTTFIEVSGGPDALTERVSDIVLAAATPKPPAVAAAPIRPPRRGFQVAFILAAGLGVAGAAAGTALAVLARKSERAADEATEMVVAYDHLDAAKSRALGASIAFGVAGGLAVTGVVLAIGFSRDIFGRDGTRKAKAAKDEDDGADAAAPRPRIAFGFTPLPGGAWVTAEVVW